MVDKVLIAPFKEGLDREVSDWMLPQDAFVRMQDAYVHRGVLKKREGFQQLATGGQGSNTTRCSSRIVIEVSSEAKGNTDGSGAASFTLSNIPVREGDISIDIGGGGETITDDGEGVLSGSIAATGTINYVTGAVTITGSLAASAILVDYFYFPGRPVMGLFNYITATNARQLIAVDTRTFNRYDSTSNRFEEVSLSGSSWNGTDSDFFSFTNYVGSDTTPSVWQKAVIFTNGVDIPQIYDGSTVNDITSATGWSQPPASIGGDLKTAKLVFYFGNRLVFLNTKQDTASVPYPQRALYSASVISGNAYSFSAVGSGVIDAPTDDEIMGADFFSNDLIVFFRNSIWALKITLDFDIPFRWERIDVDAITNCEAPFSVLSYYNEVNAAGILGIYSTDGNSVGRIDNKLPFFTRDDIRADDFKYCYSGYSIDNRQRWMTYPKIARDPEDTSFETASDILVNNVEENNWSIFTIPMHVLGTYREAFGDAWDDFEDQWDSYGEPWDSYAKQLSTINTCGGNTLGYVYEMEEGGNDDQANIIGITKASPGVISVTGHTFNTNDVVKISNVSGMVELNNRLFTITKVNNNSFSINEDTSGYTTYTSSGVVEKAISFDVKTKPMNPYIDKDMKAHLHWVDFRVDASDTTTCGVQFFSDERELPYSLPDQKQRYITGEDNGTTNLSGDSTFYLANAPIVPGSLEISISTETINDDERGILSGDASATGTVDYTTGRVEISSSIASSAISSDYQEDKSTINLVFRDGTGRSYNWFRVYVGCTARTHQVRLFNNTVDDTPKIEAIRFAFSPAGSFEGGN